MKLKHTLFVLAFSCIVLTSCERADGNYPGTEYVPDMVHSIAYEANYYDYYYYNTWGGEEEYYKWAKPRKPVANTIARGDAGIGAADYARKASMKGIPSAGSVPYHYEDTEEERTRASNEIISNPYPITDAGLARAKDLYDVQCGICHGPKGSGEGYLVSEKNPNAVYPAQPANLISDEFVNASNGRFYHAIMYGKNVMGGYADKLSYEERWQVIHYIRSLQAKDKKLAYNENENTLNQVAQPYNVWKMAHETAHAHGHDAGHHDADGSHDEAGHHDHDHSHGDHH